MITEPNFNRFKDLEWFSDSPETILVGGAGGISSWTTLLLARAGFLPIVYDFDTIEEHNIGGQLYRNSDTGKYKVTALNNIVSDFTGTNISSSKEKVDENTPSHIFAIAGFDNMKARRDMFEAWKKMSNSPVTPIFIDGRLEAESMQIFCVTPDKIDRYQEHLFDDSEVEEAPCTRKQTSHCASMIASHIVGFLTNHITNIKKREILREVPFYYEYNIPLNLTETEL